MQFLALICFTCLAFSTSAKEVYYHLTASYFDAKPDGVGKRVLGFNHQFPGPTLRAEKDDILSVTITNSIQDGQTTTIHFHGLEQYLTPWEDGPRMLTQCDIPHNSSYTYRFRLEQSGTYWYHSHHTSQYAEGLWGVIIIDNTPEVHVYDGEFLLILSDWYHPPSHELVEWYGNTALSRGGLPYPDSSLLNGAGYYPCEYAERKGALCDPSFKEKYKVFEVERGKTYRFRVVNPSTIVLYGLFIDGHQLEVIETDGVDTERVRGVDRATISTGARTSFLVRMDGNESISQFWIRSWADLVPYKLDYPNINPYPEVHRDNPWTLAVLRYKEGVKGGGGEDVSVGRLNPEGVQGRPEKHDKDRLDSLLTSGNGGDLDLPPPSVLNSVDGFSFYKTESLIHLPIAQPPFPTTTRKENPVSLVHMDCVPFAEERAPTHVNQSIILEIPHIDNPTNTEKTGINNISYDISGLDKPALMKMLRGETLPKSLNPIEILGFGHDYVVELIINDLGDTGHPFHLHGHTFWVMGYGLEGDGPFSEEVHRPNLRSGVRRETMAVQPGSWTVLRFRADSPGLWLFHCHMNFHFEAALGLVFVEGRDVARRVFLGHEPQEMVRNCRLSGIELGEVSASSTRIKYKEVLVILMISLFYGM